MLKTEIAEKSIAFFSENGWPNCVLFIGQNTGEKIQFIKEQILKELFQKRVNTNLSWDVFLRFTKNEDYPDLYVFPKEKIYIGDSENPAPYSIRYLERHFLRYAPYYSSLRFVFFPDARLIKEEAVSALLKNLEEPPPKTHFILSTEEETDLKDTIVSRSLVIPLPSQIDSEKIPAEGWARFWFYMQYEHEEVFKLAEKKNWHKKIQKSYDELNFTKKDYIVFDKLFISDFRKEFSQEPVEVQSQLLELTLKPLYHALRDSLVAGPVPELAPLRLEKMPQEKMITLYHIFQKTIYLLREQIYGNIPLNLNITVGKFLWELMQVWSEGFIGSKNPN